MGPPQFPNLIRGRDGRETPVAIEPSGISDRNNGSSPRQYRVVNPIALRATQSSSSLHSSSPSLSSLPISNFPSLGGNSTESSQSISSPGQTQRPSSGQTGVGNGVSGQQPQQQSPTAAAAIASFEARLRQHENAMGTLITPAAHAVSQALMNIRSYLSLNNSNNRAAPAEPGPNTASSSAEEPGATSISIGTSSISSGRINVPDLTSRFRPHSHTQNNNNNSNTSSSGNTGVRLYRDARHHFARRRFSSSANSRTISIQTLLQQQQDSETSSRRSSNAENRMDWMESTEPHRQISSGRNIEVDDDDDDDDIEVDGDDVQSISPPDLSPIFQRQRFTGVDSLVTRYQPPSWLSSGDDTIAYLTRNNQRHHTHHQPPPPQQQTINSQFRYKIVCQLDCRHCAQKLCNRGMKAILLADTKVELYSTDVPPQGVQMVNDDYMTENCRCRIQDVACTVCGNIVGYHVTQPCDTCLDSCNNGHFWMFQMEGVICKERMDSNQRPLLWAFLPPSDCDAEALCLKDLIAR